jgi:hypothetical protein
MQRVVALNAARFAIVQAASTVADVGGALQFWSGCF